MNQFKCECCGKTFTKVEKFTSDEILCRGCKITKYYKEHPEKALERYKKAQGTVREKYNVSNPSYIKGVPETISYNLKKFYSEEDNKKEALNKKEKTNLEKFGVSYPAQDPVINKKGCEAQLRNNGYIGWQNKELQTQAQALAHSEEAEIKRKNSWLKTLGVDHPSKSEDIKKKKIETYKSKTGYDHPQHNPEIIHSNKGYLFKGIHFDSSWELAYYIWLVDNQKGFIYHPGFFIEYEGEDGKIHKYQPDFLIEGKFYEIKGDQFFNEKNEPYNPYTKDFWWNKYNILSKNNVTILRESDVKVYLKYIKDTYGKDYLKQFRTSKLKESSTTIEITSEEDGRE